MKKKLILFFAIAATLALLAALVACNSDPQQLSAPTVSADGNTATWNAVANAAEYEVYVDGVKVATTTKTTYSLNDAVGSYSVQVKALPVNAEKYAASPLSDAVTCVVSKVAVSIVKVSDPFVTEYWVGESSQLALDGLQAVACYQNAADEPITLTSENIVSDYDLTKAGRYELDFEYQGLIGVTVRIYVRERSEVEHLDVANYWIYDGSQWTYPNSYYEITDGSFIPTSAMDSFGRSLAVVGGKVSVEDLHVGKNVLRISDGSKTVYSFVTVAYGITDKSGFKSINSDLDGYYVLLNDIDFENDGVKIGNAPLTVKWNDSGSPDTVNVDRSGIGDSVDGKGNSLNGALTGRAFNGTFDGSGHVISNYTCSQATSSWAGRHKGMGVGMFGWIGNSGTVKNFTLRSATVRGDDYSAIVAGYNEGIIENIALEDDCNIYTFYSHGALVCAYNYGTIRNVVSNVSKGTTNFSGGLIDFPFMRQDGDYMTEIGANCYVAPKNDLTDVLGDGWMYVDGHGMVFASVDYRKLLSYDNEWVVGKQYKISVCLADESLGDTLYVHSWGAYEGAVKIYNTVQKGNVFELSVGIPAFSKNSGEKVSVKIRIGSVGDAKYEFGFSVALKKQLVCVEDASGEDGASGGTVETVVGAGINLNNIPVKLIYTDNSTETSSPTGYVESTYDSSKKEEQNVTFYYYDGQNYHYVVVKILPKEPNGDFVTELKISQKQGSGVISYAYGEIIDFDAFLTFTLCFRESGETVVTAADADITAAGYVSGHRSVAFTYNDDTVGKVTASIDLDIWYVIKSADDWKLMNENLDGYFMLNSDLNLSAANSDNSLVIGKVPLVSDSEGYKIDTAGVGMEQVGKAFVGKFNGNGYKVIGFNSDFARNTGAPQAWQPTSYTLVPFAYVGAGGVVENFTLDNASVRCGQHGSLLVGLNLGTVKDIVISANCTLFVNYGGADTGAVASANGGTLENITCRVTQFSVATKTFTFQKTVYITINSGKETNCEVIA
ncbi:MAG: hypothetical protein NC132_01280 [Corallococcus sp.]|nr:hypothetical protein [Corallococcus sp.]MCM1359448.1 hypothetical protein [Corallococcus sp.]MCM1394740.1 hypothetical protein [Corallococcus sp.]